jgi:hypothetical protein
VRTHRAIGWVLLAVVSSAAISACTGSGSPRPTVGATSSVSPSSTALFSGTARAGSSTSPGTRVTTAGVPTPTPVPTTRSPGATATAAASHGASPSPSPSPSSAYPTAAPPTGGGGTAGFQDGALLGLGIAAVLAGIASIAYRRKLTRNR